MNKLPKKLNQKLQERHLNNALRQLRSSNNLIDFSSNDYLGFSKSKAIFDQAHQYLVDHNMIQNGATGSRLISGNHNLYAEVEDILCQFHNSESALVFNSGYDANIGFFSAVPQRGDVILYDEFIHASIRDGITMSNAKSYKFKHNDLEDLKHQLERSREASQDNTIYVTTESVFSMDGDSPDLSGLVKLCKNNNAYVIVDEAHAIGLFGAQGEGIIQALGIEESVFARIVTFGKAMGCHGAAVLCSEALRQYLVNFARSFIYTTGLSPHALSTIRSAYSHLIISSEREKSHNNISFFKTELKRLELQGKFIESDSAIHCCIISGNDMVKRIAFTLLEEGFDVRPILSPTVPEGKERLRFCLHSFNTKEDITKVLERLSELL